MKTVIILILVSIAFTFQAFSQTTTITGVVKDENGNAIENVSITYNNDGVVSKKDGSYTIIVAAKEEVKITFSHISFITYSKTFKIQKGKTVRFSPRLNFKTAELVRPPST